MLVQDGLLAVAAQPRTLREPRRAAGRAAAASGRATSASASLEAYQDGAGVLVALDLEHMGDARPAQSEPPRRCATSSLERKEVDGQGQHRGELVFAGARQGLAGWLSAPAPMGALGFVSPSAGAVAVFLHKDPVAMLEDVMALGKDGSGQKALAEIESKLGLRLRDDVAAALGGEVALALDGPLLPQPAWKLILEVRDADRLASALAQLVEAVNDEAAEKGKPGLRLEHEQVGDRTYHALRAIDPPFPSRCTTPSSTATWSPRPRGAMLQRDRRRPRCPARRSRSRRPSARCCRATPSRTARGSCSRT